MRDRAPGGAPGLRGAVPGRGRGADALLLGAALLAIAGLAALLGARADDASIAPLPARTVIAADVSASVTRMRGDAALWLARTIRAAAAEAVARGDEVALVTVAAEATRRFGPSASTAGLDELLRDRLADWTSADDAAALSTDLDAAAAVAVELLREGDRPPGTFVLVGDGVHTGDGDPEARLADRAVSRVEIRRPRAPERHDLAVEGVRATPRVPADVPARVAVDLALAGAVPGTADQVHLDWELRATRTGAFGGAPGLRTGSARVALADLEGSLAGAGRASLELELPPLPAGSADLVVRARLAPAAGAALPDAFAGDDSGRAMWIVGEPARVLVAAMGGRSERAARSLASEALAGVDLVPVAPSEIEARLAGEVDVDALVTLDVPLAQLPAAALRRFVVKGGGGWVHAAGWSRLRADAPRLAPLDPLEPDREPRTPRDVHFLIDGSGSMRGARWRRAKEAIARLVPALPPGDRLEVRTFTLLLGEPRIVFEAGDAGEDGAARRVRMEAALRALARTEIPGGSTDISGSLRALVAGAAEETFGPVVGERERVVVLLTDGEETMGRGNGPRMRALLAETRTRLVPLVVGDGARGRAYLESFLPPGERARVVGELDRVYAELQAAVEGTDPVADALAVTSAPGPAPAALSRLRTAVQRARPAAPPLGLDLVLPCRARGPRRADRGSATALLDAVLAETTERGAEERRRVGALVAAAEHGAGLTVGIALPLLDADGRAWAPELNRDPRWLAPILADMAARRRAAADPPEGPRAAIVGTGPGRIEVRGLSGEAARAAVLDAELVVPGGFDALGLPEPRRRIARLRLAPARLDPDGASVRVAPRPPALDAVPRGTRLEVRLDAAEVPPLPLQADGPAELRGLARAPSVRTKISASRADGGAGPPPRLAAPAHVPWLLGAGLLAIVLGALRRHRAA